MKTFHCVFIVGGGMARAAAELSGRALADLPSQRAQALHFCAGVAGR